MMVTRHLVAPTLPAPDADDRNVFTITADGSPLKQGVDDDE